MDIDRRRHERYRQADLHLEVARPGIKGILQINPTSECMDFSLAGLNFGSNQQFRKGDRLIIDITVYDIEVNELRAEVITCQKRDNGIFCTGVRFCFEEKSMQKPEISHALLKIEDKLRVANEYPLSTNPNDLSANL